VEPEEHGGAVAPPQAERPAAGPQEGRILHRARHRPVQTEALTVQAEAEESGCKDPEGAEEHKAVVAHLLQPAVRVREVPPE
jgi:hypothetical protein